MSGLAISTSTPADMFFCRKDDDAKSPTTRCMLNLLDPEEVLDDVFEQERMWAGCATSLILSQY